MEGKKLRCEWLQSGFQQCYFLVAMSDLREFGDSELGRILFLAAVIIAVLLGVWGCQLMLDYGQHLREPSIVKPQMEKEK